MKRLAALLLIMLLALPACTPRDDAGGLTRYETSFIDVFDTVTTVTFYAPDADTAKRWSDDLHARLLHYHQLYDIYNSYDGLNNARTVNENAGKAPIEADATLIGLILFAQDMHAQTGGTMNVAMGSVLSIWHDYREAGLENPEEAALPPMEMLREAAKHTDIGDVIVDEAAGTIYLADPLLSLDLGAVAKGYAAQCIADEMRRAGVTSMLLSIGGNVCCIGARADGRDWRVAVESPGGQTEMPTLSVNGQSLVTSGSYQRYYTVDGVAYHHVIDPATLMPAAYFISVTVLCADSGLADALSTALFNLPLEEGKALASRAGVEALWVAPDGTQTMTEGFRARLDGE